MTLSTTCSSFWGTTRLKPLRIDRKETRSRSAFTPHYTQCKQLTSISNNRIGRRSFRLCNSLTIQRTVPRFRKPHFSSCLVGRLDCRWISSLVYREHRNPSTPTIIRVKRKQIYRWHMRSHAETCVKKPPRNRQSTKLGLRFPSLNRGNKFSCAAHILPRTDLILSCTVPGGDRTWCNRKFRPSCRVKKARADAREISVHLAHLKPYYAPTRPPAPDFEQLQDLFLGKKIPLPAIDHDNQQLIHTS